MSKLNGVYYLNNSGSRWVVYKDGKKEKIELLTHSGKKVIRTVNYYTSFGNHAVANISYKSQRINIFSDSTLND